MRTRMVYKGRWICTRDHYTGLIFTSQHRHDATVYYGGAPEAACAMNILGAVEFVEDDNEALTLNP